MSNYVHSLQDEIHKWCYSDERSVAKSIASQTSKASITSRKSRDSKAISKDSGRSITSLVGRMNENSMRKCLIAMMEQEQENQVQKTYKIPKTVDVIKLKEQEDTTSNKIPT